MRTAVILLLLLAANACQLAGPLAPSGSRDDGGASDRVLSTERSTYVAGTQAVILLTNRFEYSVGYNLCFSVLERRVNGQWITAESQRERVCTAELRLLAPGKTDSYTFRLDPGLPAGEYRFRTTLENMSSGARAAVVSNSFTVTR